MELLWISKYLKEVKHNHSYDFDILTQEMKALHTHFLNTLPDLPIRYTHKIYKHFSLWLNILFCVVIRIS